MEVNHLSNALHDDGSVTPNQSIDKTKYDIVSANNVNAIIASDIVTVRVRIAVKIRTNTIDNKAIFVLKGGIAMDTGCKNSVHVCIEAALFPFFKTVIGFFIHRYAFFEPTTLSFPHCLLIRY